MKPSPNPLHLSGLWTLVAIVTIAAVLGPRHGVSQEEEFLEEQESGRLEAALRSYLEGDEGAAIYQVRRHVANNPHDLQGLRLLRRLAPGTRRPVSMAGTTNRHLAGELLRRASRHYLQGQLGRARDLAERARDLDPGLVSPDRLLEKIHATTVPPETRDPYERLFGDQEDELTVTGSFHEAPLASVLEAFLRHSPRSVVVEGAATRPLTISFNRLSPGQAFKSLLTTAGYALEERENGELAVRPVDPDLPETRVYRLENIILDRIQLGSGEDDGEESGGSGVVETEESPTLIALRSALSEEGDLNYDPGQRILIVTDLPARHGVIEKLIRQIDQPARQVAIHARVVEISDSDLRELGVAWDLNYGASLTSVSRPTTFPFFSGHDFLKDLRPPKDPSDDEFPSGSIDGSDGLFPFAGSGDFTFGRFLAGDLGVDVRLAQILGRSEILSSPRVVAIDGTLAQIQVGDRIPIPTLSTNSETGNTVVTGFEEERVGILLQVVPHVLGNGLIRLSVHPEVSAVTGFVGDGNQRPIISTREVTTQVILKHRTTFVIGGLIRDSEIETTNKVPWIGDIPVLGQLFRDRTTDGEKTELVIFITVSIEDDGRDLSPRELEMYQVGER